MDTFFITPTFVSLVGLVTLFLVMALYLLSLRSKLAATWWLALFCAAFAINVGGWSLQELVPPQKMPEGIRDLMMMLGNGGAILLQWVFVQFAYTFRGNPFPREFRVVFAVTTFLTVGGLWVNVVSPETTLMLLFPLFSVLFPIWTLIVFVRKMYRFSRDAVELGRSKAAPSDGHGRRRGGYLLHPEGRAARGCRAFVWLSVAILVVGLSTILVWIFPIQPDLFTVVFNLSLVLITFGLLINYVNYAPEPATIQVKLVGTTLVTVVAVFYGIGYLFSSDQAREVGLLPVPARTIHLTPDGRGGYRVAEQPLRFDDAPGERLDLGYESDIVVPLDFDFPFYDKTWQEAYVNSNGAVAFGGTIHPDDRIATTLYDFYNARPKIALFFTDLNPEPGGVYVKREPERFTLTWRDVPLNGHTDPSTMQLVLHADGVIDMSYRVISEDVALYRANLRGIHPGGTPPVVSLRQSMAAAVPPGAAIAEDWVTEMMRQSHPIGVKILILMLFTVVFVLVIFPMLFRTSLIKPLNVLLKGVKDIQDGDLDVVIPFQAYDEIGTLTQHVNTMAYAIRRAEQKLKDYAETLEHRVDERTAALQQSLNELKQAQARLIQAEKMASLGQLTAGIAHEIKNPLNFVNNFAQLTTELAGDIETTLDGHRQRLPEEVAAELEDLLSDLKINTSKIYEHGCRADGIVRAMMDHARSSEGERRPVNLRALLEEYINLAYHGMRATTPDFNVTIERAFGDAVGEVELMPQEIGRVLLNLLDNAFYAVYQKATSGHGAYVPTVSVQTRRRDDHVEVRIRDNGPGIPAAFQEKIFEPFFTTKPTGSGTGLGLSLSYEIVTQGHGGTLTVESEEGKGTTFIMMLPH